MRYVGLVVVLFLLALSACGFHMRQTPQLSPEMKLLYISSSEQAAGLVRELARALGSENTHIVTDPKQATATLAIQRASQTSRVLSVNNLGQPLEYEVAYEVQFSLITNGKAGIPLQDLTLTRNYTYSISNAVANQEQANVLYNALDRDMAQLIVFRIEAASRSAVSPRSAPAVATIKLPSVATRATPAVL
jgi:LPS-assembly lipoprotein